MADKNHVRYSLASSARKSVDEARLDSFRQCVAKLKMILTEMHDNNSRILELRSMLSKNSSARAEKCTCEVTQKSMNRPTV
jgi:hypothetical protein